MKLYSYISLFAVLFLAVVNPVSANINCKGKLTQDASVYDLAPTKTKVIKEYTTQCSSFHTITISGARYGARVAVYKLETSGWDLMESGTWRASYYGTPGTYRLVVINDGEYPTDGKVETSRPLG